MGSAAASPRKRHALQLFEGLPRRYDRTGAVMSFGQDPRWRAAMVSAVRPQPGQRILDVATGTGMVASALAQQGAVVTALDQSEAMLEVARAHSRPGITFVHGEAEHLPFDDAAFDALTFTYLLRYVDDPAATLRELARVVKPGGRIGMVEFGVPDNAVLGGCGGSTRARGCRSWVGWSRPRGMRWAGSWARTSSSSHSDLTPTSRGSGPRRASRASSSAG